MSGKGKWYEWPFGGMFKGEEGGIEKTSTLSPEQQEIMGQLAPFIQERIGEGLPGWEGAFTAPPSEYEEMGLSQLGEYLSRSPTEGITGVGLGAFQDLLQTSPEQIHDWYMQYIAPQEQRYMEETVVPGIKESKVAPGTLYGTPYSKGVSDAWTQFGEGQLGRIGGAIQSQRGLAAGMLPHLGQMAELEGGMPQIRAAMQHGALPRLIEQTELAMQFEEMKRTTPELSPILDLALNLLNVTTQAAFYREPQESPFMELLGAVAPGVGAYLGSK